MQETCRWNHRAAGRWIGWVVASGLLFAPLNARGGDWPQILGPNRTGVAVDEALVDAFPRGGPKTLWSQEIGEGFAGVAISQGSGVLFHRRGNQEIAWCFDAATGKQRWERPFPATFSGGYSKDTGPRCVPLIHQDAVYLFGAAGDLHCLRMKDGEVNWSRRLYKEVKGAEGFFGAGSAPIVDGDLLLINAGGAKGAGLMGLGLADGKTVWSVSDEQASYSAPAAAQVGGVRQVIFVTRLNCVSVDPKTGKEFWRFPFGDRGPTVNAATPVVVNGHVFVSASYGIGARLAKIGASSAEEVWSNNETMSSQYTTCVLHEGLLYGTDGRADQGGARLRCFDPMTGKVRWTEEGFGVAHAILADKKLVLWKDDGTLVLAKATSEGYEELGSHPIFKSTSRALPALSNGRLYLHDSKRLVCVDLRRP